MYVDLSLCPLPTVYPTSLWLVATSRNMLLESTYSGVHILSSIDPLPPISTGASNPMPAEVRRHSSDARECAMKTPDTDARSLIHHWHLMIQLCLPKIRDFFLTSTHVLPATMPGIIAIGRVTRSHPRPRPHPRRPFSSLRSEVIHV